MGTNSLTDNQIYSLISEFKIDAGIASVKPFGSGHINDTYRIVNANINGHDYLLQRVNHHVFKDVPLLMNNLLNVSRHLKQKIRSEQNVLTIIETRDNRPYFKDDGGNYWRVFYFLKGTKSYDVVTTEKQAFEGGKAFGAFLALLADLDVSLVKDTIPNFHNIEYRLANLQKAIDTDKAGRLKEVAPEIGFIQQRSDAMSEISRLGRSGVLPLRIVHNDTKFNNVLLDQNDNAQCVIDLDTVMPGYVAYDFGDSIRTIINTVAEDEADVNHIGLNLHLFKAYTKGFLQEAKPFLTESEISSLLKGVLLLPYIQAVRFLTDYLEGDHYFKIHFFSHNLQRVRAQLALVAKLEENQHILGQIITKTWQQLKV
ncbi:phosphotransferase enzyme family protein [Mucilaginibacter ginsenosidivorans]|nr:aminoglycoside phosphotransferase family protein [Mucilaginibacter ginsenosidivorans]